MPNESMINRLTGLDLMDLLIHFGITFSLMGAVSASDGPIEVMPMIFAASLVVLAFRRARALKRSPSSTGEFTLERVDEIEERLRDVDQLHNRVLELEERLDFAERLLARAPEAGARLSEPK